MRWPKSWVASGGRALFCAPCSPRLFFGLPVREAAGDHSLARLFLRAVLPALPVYVQTDETARSTVEGWRFAVRFASASGVATTLAFHDGVVAVDGSRSGFALRLFFFSDRDVVRAFRRQGTPRVLPWGGLHHLARLPAFLGLLSRMGETLTLPAGGRDRSSRRELRAELLLACVLPAAVAELGAHDGASRRLLAPFGDFVAQLSVSGSSGGWLRRRGDDWACGQGPAPSLPDVRIEFRDPDVALAAVDGLIDALAASVTREISVRGMIPLADALAQVMERVSMCLDQSGS